MNNGRLQVKPLCEVLGMAPDDLSGAKTRKGEWMDKLCSCWPVRQASGGRSTKAEHKFGVERSWWARLGFKSKQAPELAILLSQRKILSQQEMQVVPSRSPSPEQAFFLEDLTRLGSADDAPPASAASAGLPRRLSATPVSLRPSTLEALVTQRSQALGHADLAEAVAKALSGLNRAQATGMLFKRAQSLAGHPKRLALIFQGLCHGAIKANSPVGVNPQALADQLEAIVGGLLSVGHGEAALLTLREARAAFAVLLRCRKQMPLPALCLLTEAIARHIPAHHCEALLMLLACEKPDKRGEADDALAAAAIAVPVARRLLAGQGELMMQTAVRLLLKVGQQLGDRSYRADRGLALGYAIGRACAVPMEEQSKLMRGLISHLLVRDRMPCGKAMKRRIRKGPILIGLSLCAGARYLQDVPHAWRLKLVAYLACALPADLGSVDQDLMLLKPSPTLEDPEALRRKFRAISGYQPPPAGCFPDVDAKAHSPLSGREDEIRRSRSVSEPVIAEAAPRAGAGGLPQDEDNFFSPVADRLLQRPGLRRHTL